MKHYHIRHIFFILFFIFFFGCGSKAQPLNEDYITIKGMKFYYKIEGTGITAMVIGSAIEQPRMFSQELRKHFKFIFVDTRLFVSSNVDKFTLNDAVKDIEYIRKYLKIDKMLLIGNSMLSIIALEYAKKYPKRVSHLAMIGISPIFDDSYLKERNEYWEKHATDERKQLWEENMKKLSEVDLTKVSPGEARVLDYVANGPKRCYDANYNSSWLFEGVHVNMSDGIMDFIKSYYKYDITNKIKNVTMPVLLVVGQYDFNNPYYLWNDFKSKFANLEYHLFNKSGHHPMLEETELFNQTLIDFISQDNK